jgi:hypothetical protein
VPARAPGEPTFRDVVLDSIRDLRGLLARYNLGPRECKAYLLRDYEADAAVIYARIEGIVLAVVASCDYDDDPLAVGSYWDVFAAVNVDEEAIDDRRRTGSP